MAAIITLSEEQRQLDAESQDSIGNIDEDNALHFLVTFIDGMKSLADGEVWFMVHGNHGRYYNICLYYDNLHNQAHGEAL